MGFRFKRRESVTGGLRRIASQEFDAVEEALGLLEKGDAKGEALHAVRKNLKRLRALLQLLWGADAAYDEESRRLRGVAQQLGIARDAGVRLALLQKLIDETGAPPQAARERLLAEWTEEEGQALRVASKHSTVIKLHNAIHEARRWFDQATMTHRGWALLACGLSRAYRRARESFQAVRETSGEHEVSHDWRKRTKVLEYQLTLLRSAHGSVAALVEDLHKLTECLGCEHDLSFLNLTLRTQQVPFVSSDEGSRILAMIRLRQEEHRAQALKLGERLFDSKTGPFVEDIGRRWKTWRDD